MEIKKNDEVFEIDIMQILQAVYKKLWLVIIFAIIAGAIANVYVTNFVDPKYEASIKLYVNTNSVSIGSSTISFSSGEFTSSKNLVDTYIVILETRSVLEAVDEKSGLSYGYKEIKNMITSSAVDNTAIFQVTVTSSVPEHAMIIANTIGEVLPEKIGYVIDGCSAVVVDYAVLPNHKVSPSIPKYTLIGALIGMVISVALIVILDMLDDLVHGEDYLTSTYRIPVLASIPDLRESVGGYGRYSKYNKYGKYGKYGSYSRYGKSSTEQTHKMFAKNAYERANAYEIANAYEMSSMFERKNDDVKENTNEQ